MSENLGEAAAAGEGPLVVHTMELVVAVQPYSSGLAAALVRTPKIETETFAWQTDLPGVVSLPLVAPLPKVRSYHFSAVEATVFKPDSAKPRPNPMASPAPPIARPPANETGNAPREAADSPTAAAPQKTSAKTRSNT